MSLQTYSQDEIVETSMLELANAILDEEKKAMDFRELFDQVAELKGFNESQKQEKLAQFYTDLNINGRFMTIGNNLWGLKHWYPVDQSEEDIALTPKKKKKKKATRAKKEVIEEDLDEDLDEEDLDFDESIELSADDDFEDEDNEELDDDYDDYDDLEDEEDYSDDEDEDEDDDLIGEEEELDDEEKD